MEGNNRQRRQRARRARNKGTKPSKAQVTLGASKTPEHLPHGAKHEERERAPDRGKQRTEVDKGPRQRG